MDRWQIIVQVIFQSEEANILIKAVDEELGKSCRFYAGVSYRHLLVMKNGQNSECTPPHDVLGQSIEEVLPRGEDSDYLFHSSGLQKPSLKNTEINLKRKKAGKNTANLIWPWDREKLLTCLF